MVNSGMPSSVEMMQKNKTKQTKKDKSTSQAFFLHLLRTLQADLTSR